MVFSAAWVFAVNPYALATGVLEPTTGLGLGAAAGVVAISQGYVHFAPSYALEETPTAEKGA